VDCSLVPGPVPFFWLNFFFVLGFCRSVALLCSLVFLFCNLGDDTLFHRLFLFLKPLPPDHEIPSYFLLGSMLFQAKVLQGVLGSVPESVPSGLISLLGSPELFPRP